MKYAVDRIINNIALLENIENGTKTEISINLLPKSLHEGAIIVYKNGTYLLDETEEEKRRRLIQEKFQKLQKNT